MKRVGSIVIGVGLLLAATTLPAGAQNDSISVTPADSLVDGQTVDVSATTTGSDYATLALCPAAAAPTVGTMTTDLLSTKDICVGLLCLHEGDVDPGLAESVAGDCPLSAQAAPIASVDVSVALPRLTSDGTDCAVEECVVVFNTWTSSAAQGAVSAPVRFEPTGTPPPTVAPEATTATIELSAPSATSTVPAAITTSTVAAEVLGAQETDAGELAVTGVGAGEVAGLGVVLVAAGAGVLSLGRRDG